MGKEETDFLCYCVINCKDLRQVIDYAARFAGMLGGRSGKLSLQVAAEKAFFRMSTLRHPRSASGLMTDLTGLSFFHRLFSWLIGEPLPILGYGVTYGERENREALLRLFHHPILYSQACNHFQFPARFLDKAVVRNYQQLVELLAVFPFDLMLAPSSDGLFSEAIEQLIAAKLHKGENIPSLGSFADFFSMSSATLRRRLAKEGVSFNTLKERCRRDAAFQLLRRDPKIRVADVAGYLGFNDARTFRRAFRSWTGESPDQYRRGFLAIDPEQEASDVIQE